MNEGDGQIAQSSHDLRSRASVQAGAIFPKGDIAHIMRTILNAPMATPQLEEASRTGLDLSEVGDEIDHLLGDLAGLAHPDVAGQTSDLTHQWPGGSQVVIHATTDLDGAGLDPPSPPIDATLLLVGCNDRVGITEIGGQIRIESGLIAFDGQYTGPRAHLNDLHEGGVGRARPLGQ